MNIGKNVTLLAVSALFYAPFLSANENIDALLASYKSDVEFSRITKREAAGFLTVYTRNDLEKMQARTLMDIYKLLNIPSVSRNQLGTSYFVKPSQPYMPNCSVRLFINGHNMSTGASNTAFSFSNMSLEHIDHIVIYTSTSSIEFGNEPGTIIIKLFTKDPKTEEGEKIKISTDSDQSLSLSAYSAHTLDNGLSYFVFASGENLNRKTYYNQTVPLDSDEKNLNIYGNLSSDQWQLELSLNRSESAPFLGNGINHTPEDDPDALQIQQSYIHFTNQFENGLRVQLSYDVADSLTDITDDGGIPAGDLGLVTHSYTDTTDKVFSLIMDKKFKTENNQLFIGGFYKHKTSDYNGMYDTTNVMYDDSVNLYSIYAENTYKFDIDTLFVASLKYDYYDYQEIENNGEYIARVGFIKNFDQWQIKTFYTDTYYQTPLSYFYSDDQNIPYITNKDLKNIRLSLASFGFRYKTEKHELKFNTAYVSVKNKIIYDPQKGYINLARTNHYTQYEATYSYFYDKNNRFILTYYGGYNDQGLTFSPKDGVTVRLFNTYEEFDFYNELIYKDGYSLYGINVDPSYNFTSSVKYHYSEDLTFALKAENIFDKSYEQVYQGLSIPIQVYDRKVWVSMEYLF